MTDPPLPTDPDPLFDTAVENQVRLKMGTVSTRLSSIQLALQTTGTPTDAKKVLEIAKDYHNYIWRSQPTDPVVP